MEDTLFSSTTWLMLDLKFQSKCSDSNFQSLKKNNFRAKTSIKLHVALTILTGLDLSISNVSKSGQLVTTGYTTR